MTLMISGGGGGGGGGATALSGLSDVTLAALASGQILQYNSGTGQWENTALTGQLTYKGSFNATTGTPALTNALKGDFYVIDVAGTQFGVNWSIGDHLIVNDDMGGVIDPAKIDKIDNTDAVASVNGATGVVNLYADDATLNLAGTGLVTSGTGATSTLNADVGTGANQLVQLDGSSRLPAVDGSQLTNLPAAPVDSVNGATGVVNLYADDATLNLAGTGLVTSGAGATSTLNADVGTGANQLVQLDGSSRLPAVDGSQLTNLPAAPVDSVNGATGVVNLYADDATLNLAGTGLVTSGTGATSTLNADVGTGANQLVQLDGSSRLPAVDGSQLTNLPSAPVTSVNGATGAVNLYADDATLNLAGTGLVTSGTGATSTLNADVGTGANQLVQLDGSSRLPAVDGSQLTNLPSAPVTSVNGATGAVNLYADDATLNLAGTGLVTSGTGATSTLNADVGTGANQLVQLDGSSRLPAVVMAASLRMCCMM